MALLSNRLGCLLIALCFQVHAVFAANLYPVDDTARDPSFRSYVRKLRSAVDARDTRAFRKLVDDDVLVGPSASDKGWTKFVARWRPVDRQSSTLWDVLATLLSLGFVQEHPRLFLSPYLVWRFPRELDPKTHLVVVRDHAPMREAPSARAPSSSTLSFDIVERLGPAEAGSGAVQWIQVRTAEGKTGYVDRRDVMSPSMPRAQFVRDNGRWLLVALEDPEH